MTEIKYYSPEMLPVVPLAESDFHGASFVFNKLYNKGLPSPIIGKTLKHGWTPNRFIKHTRQVIHWGEKEDLHLCFNKFQQNYLVEKGYEKSIFVGAPFAHALRLIKPLNIQKIPNSLLIMPQHTLRHIKTNMFSDTFMQNAVKMAQEERFDHIAMCIHRQSMDERLISFAKENNIQVIIGASEYDSKSLVNQAILFSNFTNVLTNSIGSHVIYGLYSHCDLKIIDLYQHTEEEVSQHSWFQQHPEIMETGLYNERNAKNIYPELFSQGWVSRKSVSALLEEEIPLPAEDLSFLFKRPLSARWLVKNLFRYLKFKSNIQNMLSQSH